MTQVAGITFKKSKNGNIESVTFDYSKYSNELNSLFNKIGIEIESDDDAEFEKKWAKGGLTPEEFREKALAYVRTLEWKKK